MTGRAVFLHRRSPADRAAWHAARSWFGGRPRMPHAAWPRTGAGTPMTFLAQVALDALPPNAAPEGVPRSGALAFFAQLRNGEPEGTVVAVAPGEDAEEAAPPDDLPQIYGEDLRYIRRELPFPTGAPVAFPRWPMRFAMEAPDEPTTRPQELFDPDDLDAFPLRPEALARVLRLVGNRVNADALARIDALLSELSQEAAEPVLFVRPKPSLLDRLLPHRKRARVDALKAAAAQAERMKRVAFRVELASFERRDVTRRLADLEALAPRAVAAIARSAPNAFHMDDAAAVADIYRALLSPTPSGPGPGNPNHRQAILPATVAEARIAEIVEHALASDAAWSELTEAERSLVAADLAEDPNWPHQMFGEGADLQGRGPSEPSSALLLQLFCDDPMGWVFGDAGRIQFLLEWGALRMGRWQDTRVEIAGH